MTTPQPRPKIILVTGPSGAGRSTAIKVFEDMGYETIDSMPLALLPRLLQGPPTERSIALGIDVRTRDFTPAKVLDLFKTLQNMDVVDGSLLFLDSSIETLLRRYSETRRRHPLSPDDTPIKGIEQEKQLLETLRNQASTLIDTSNFTPHDLKAEIGTLFGNETAETLAISFQSFSYKRGVPRGIDMMLDCRFLKNPHWEKTLRAKTGLDQAVRDYIETDSRYQPFFAQVQNMLELLLPAYQQEGKAHFSIGFGCTGGKHRSVTLTEELSKALAEQGWQVSIRHRELERMQGV